MRIDFPSSYDLTNIDSIVPIYGISQNSHYAIQGKSVIISNDFSDNDQVQAVSFKIPNVHILMNKITNHKYSR